MFICKINWHFVGLLIGYWPTNQSQLCNSLVARYILCLRATVGQWHLPVRLWFFLLIYFQICHILLCPSCKNVASFNRTTWPVKWGTIYTSTCFTKSTMILLQIGLLFTRWPLNQYDMVYWFIQSIPLLLYVTPFQGLHELIMCSLIGCSAINKRLLLHFWWKECVLVVHIVVNSGWELTVTHLSLALCLLL